LADGRLHVHELCDFARILVSVHRLTGIVDANHGTVVSNKNIGHQGMTYPGLYSLLLVDLVAANRLKATHLSQVRRLDHWTVSINQLLGVTQTFLEGDLQIDGFIGSWGIMPLGTQRRKLAPQRHMSDVILHRTVTVWQ